MEEIDLKDMFSYFLSKKVYIIFMILFCLVVGSIYTAVIQKPKYKSYTTILLTKESDTSITSTDITLNKNLVDTYREIIKSKKVLNKVIDNLGLNYSYSKLNQNVTVESINDTEIIKVSVVDLNPRVSRDIANEIASVFNIEVVKLYNIQNIGVVDVAEAPSAPFNVNLIKQLILAIFIGFVLGCGIVFVLYYFDTTVKSAEEIEKKLGLPVIGRIPKSGGGKHD